MSSAIENIEYVLTLNREFPAIECKTAFHLDNSKWILGKTLRAMMGMANLQGGGVVIIGISENKPNLSPTPFVATDLASWSYEKFQAKVAPYFDPPIIFELENISYNGNDYIVISIKEFDHIPVLAKKNYEAPKPPSTKIESIFRDGACYIRSQARLSTEEVPSATEMRTLIDYAIEKGINKELNKLRKWGLITTLPVPTPKSDKDKFDDQIKGII